MIFALVSTERGVKVGRLWSGPSLWHSREVLLGRGRALLPVSPTLAV